MKNFTTWRTSTLINKININKTINHRLRKLYLFNLVLTISVLWKYSKDLQMHAHFHNQLYIIKLQTETLAKAGIAYTSASKNARQTPTTMKHGEKNFRQQPRGKQSCYTNCKNIIKPNSNLV